MHVTEGSVKQLACPGSDPFIFLPTHLVAGGCSEEVPPEVLRVLLGRWTLVNLLISHDYQHKGSNDGSEFYSSTLWSRWKMCRIAQGFHFCLCGTSTADVRSQL